MKISNYADDGFDPQEAVRSLPFIGTCRQIFSGWLFESLKKPKLY